MLVTGTIFSIVLVYVAYQHGLCHRQPTLTLIRGSALAPPVCIDLFLLLSSTNAVLLYVIFTD